MSTLANSALFTKIKWAVTRDFQQCVILASVASGEPGDKNINIALVLQDEWLTIFTRPANSCICPLKAYAIKNIREQYAIWLPGVILPKALILQDEYFGKNYSSFLDFTRKFEQTSGIFVPCKPVQPPFKLRDSKWSSVSSLTLIEYLNFISSD